MNRFEQGDLVKLDLPENWGEYRGTCRRDDWQGLVAIVKEDTGYSVRLAFSSPEDKPACWPYDGFTVTTSRGYLKRISEETLDWRVK